MTSLRLHKKRKMERGGTFARSNDRAAYSIAAIALVSGENVSWGFSPGVVNSHRE